MTTNFEEEINQDFTKHVIVFEGDQIWHSSPSSGVSRIFLERNNLGEFATATSIVKFEAGSRFSSHIHENGEEIFVLEGVFSDEFGDYPVGSYVRNPNGSIHNPFSEHGCKIFVKLRQFQFDDHKRVVKSINDNTWSKYTENCKIMNLHEHNDEYVYLLKCNDCVEFRLPSLRQRLQEILIFSGTVVDGTNEYTANTWIRNQGLCLTNPSIKNQPVLIYVKCSNHI